MVAQPSTGFLNVRFQPDGSPTEDTEDCLGRITVGLTRSKSLTLVVSPLDMMGLIGMAQVLATLAYGVQGLRRGVTTWDWPSFNTNPARENNSQMERWSLNVAPSWSSPPIAIANQYHDQRSNQPQNVRYRLILVRASDLDWLQKDQHSLRNLYQIAAAGHNWIPVQDLPFDELILFAYAADRTPRPTYVCLPSGLYHARTGRVLPQTGPSQEITPLPGIYFFDGWRVQPTLDIPSNLPSTKEAPAYGVGTTTHTPRGTEPTRSPEKRHGTYLPQRPRTNRKMDPALAGLPSVHVNTLEQWLANMAPNYRQCTMPRKYMHNAVEEAQQLKRPNIGRRKVNSQW